VSVPQEYWHHNTQQQQRGETIRGKKENGGGVVTWAVFRREFLNRYFPEDVREKKEIEFLELKQGYMTVTEYAAKFVELAKFYPHYIG